MREYFGFISILLTLIVFFGLFMHANGYIIFLIPISIVLAVFAPKGTEKTFAVAGLIISGIIYACIFILFSIIGAGLAETHLR